MTKNNILWVTFSMDVERILELSPVGGPLTWEQAERSVRSYCDILMEKGYPATLFIVPDTAEKQSELLRALAREGHECGMHFHDQGWKDHWQTPDEYKYLGEYSGEMQKKYLAEARDQTAQALGFTPDAFRPGNLSANDETFVALREVGFTHGSNSLPGRHWPVVAEWQNACLDVHRTHRESRLIPGDMDFVEIPITGGQTTFVDTRFEDASGELIADTIEKSIQRQIQEGVAFKHICLFTHNFVRYWDAEPTEDEYVGIHSLRMTLERLPEIAAAAGLEVRGATMKSIREAFLADADNEEK